MEGKKIDISVVIPIFDEEENLPLLYEKLKKVLDSLGKEYEIIFVNDGSRDRSWEIIKEFAEKDSHVVGVNFRKNFGQTAAMSAGFETARGEVIITMDGDLQNDPEDIPKLLELIDQGYDIVSGWRKDRKDAFLSRTLPSRIANWLISKVTGVHLHDYGCSLKAYRADVAKQLDFYGEMHRFLPALSKSIGAKITEIPVKHHPRIYGKSKYGISRTFKVLLDLMLVKFLLDYRTKPLRVFGGTGAVLFLFGSITLSYLVLIKVLFGQDIGNRPLLIFGTLFVLSGIQLVSTGIVAELITRTYYESQGKRPYIIKEIVKKES
ncbi:MAG TPA: glycosyltransferase [Persephonella sp.]|uniref:Undecaprenyl-phosphate 4-deoxy-4-formamido-L-arabinose transferase (Undecaprenyl-phosphate Ara4FN transferase) (Ara4FNtransferase) n=1 Tax=Persephonella marina (strain DSM 14350 / EX-H1) TaxID=123214 RepID=C0QPJ0_PERMH|nr:MULTISPECIES: glycosyltransferase family 2 protein [Persephonella]ACO03050.1 undecaprenyl-phosphate 4-deoxy-4-formamido-L-arabinose transferase (Undecaprenyl-phosphate Ara4FN transferase) (Ara4FNtransferase) [Persephonella marina EX-H1]HCB69799.1 glycosyltransferase [Persephonella sp.]